MATKEEEKYQADLAAEGVDLTDIADDTEIEPKPKDEPEEKDEPVETAEEEEPEGDDKKKPEEKKPQLPDPEKPHKRSIYDDLKDKKKEVKTAIERADIAEKQVLELQEKLDAVADAKEKGKPSSDAEDDLETFLTKYEVNPDVAKRLIAEARKGLKPEIDESLMSDIAEFKTWKSDHKKVLETQAFETEFTAALPSLKDLFPTANADELTAIKGQLNTISHTKEWHDKSLKYIAFEHKDQFSALITPRKKGMESRQRQDVDEPSTEFNTAPDFSKMTSKEIENWEKQYRDAGRTDSLATNKQGKKIWIG